MAFYHRVIILCLAIIGLGSGTGHSCTTFCLDRGDQPVFGRNYDWMVEDGLVMINKRGVMKKAQSDLPDSPSKWTSAYGSVTFNQYGREFPMGGMNETGLVVETMMLEETEYPLADTRPEISVLQWIQYQLDNYASIEEVIAGGSTMRIRKSVGPGCHFLVCDIKGDCAVIEFIDGALVYYTKEEIPVKTLTNSTYAESISTWKNNSLPQYDKFQSLDRFTRAATMVQAYIHNKQKAPIEYAFDILNDVAHPTYTKWRIVYDIKNLGVYFKTLENRSVRHFNLKAFDLSCKTPVQVLDINAGLSGNVFAAFRDYSHPINLNLLRNAFKKTPFLSHFSDHVIEQQSRYPETTHCTE